MASSPTNEALKNSPSATNVFSNWEKEGNVWVLIKLSKQSLIIKILKTNFSNNKKLILWKYTNWKADS